MKHLLFILITIISSSTALAQDKIYFNENWEETSKKKAMYYRIVEQKDDLYEIKDYYLNGDIQYIGYATNAEKPFNLHGEAIWYFENGNVSQKATYTNNVADGLFEEYYENGTLKSRFYLDNGLKTGESIGYFPTGEVAVQIFYVNDKMDGFFTKYNSPGQLEYKVGYKNGVIHGPYEMYFGTGDLSNKGNAKDGYQDGLCTDYYYDGPIQKMYTMKNQALDGIYIEFDIEGDTSVIGHFKEGIALDYEVVSPRKSNNSEFTQTMELIDGVEVWKMYRDGALVMSSFYKKGFKTGIWRLYTYDGKELYETQTFEERTDCGEAYKQLAEEPFRPRFTLAERFRCPSTSFENVYCDGVDIEYHQNYTDKHPIYYYNVNPSDDATEDVEIVRDYAREYEAEEENTLNYKDPSQSDEFLVKNNCEVHSDHDDVQVCTKDIDGIVHIVYLSQNVKTLKKLKQAAVPNDNEIHFFYQQFEERVYDFNKEDRPDRYLGFTFSKLLMNALEDGIYDYISVIGVYEKQFWDAASFSGLSAYEAYELEVDSMK